MCSVVATLKGFRGQLQPSMLKSILLSCSKRLSSLEDHPVSCRSKVSSFRTKEIYVGFPRRVVKGERLKTLGLKWVSEKRSQRRRGEQKELSK